MEINKYLKMGVRELERLVRHHNHLYFVEKNPEISDYEFDRLVEALKGKKPESEALAEIGSDLTTESQKVRHETAMLSLNKAYDIETLNNWASKFSGKIISTPKVDGCAVSIKYDASGKLFEAATRGSGTEGELITKNILEVKDIPQKVDHGNIEVRGEVYMPLSVFSGYAAEFANPRNLAAGAIKQKDPKKTADYGLSFWSYDLLGLEARTEEEKIRFLKKNKFPVLDMKVIGSGDIQEVFAYFLSRREKYDFETDGVVFKVNDVSEQKRLGVTAHHPRFGIAYKFQGDSGETTLLDVEWSVSRTGVITPVGMVEPVELSGAMVARASLHNYGLMKKLGLTKGARVMMMRRGGVIPNLEKVVRGGNENFEPPKHCPSCGAATEVRDDFLYCTNSKGCMKTRISELEHFIKTIECDGFGEKLITQLYDADIVVGPADFYSLTKDELMRLERMGDVLAEKLVRNINAKRELTLGTFLRSLGIREFGRHAADILAKTYGDLKKIRHVTEEELSGIHSIGDVIAGHIVHGLKEKSALIDRLMKEVRIVEREEGSGGIFSGKKFLFTGSMNSMGRKDAQNKVEEVGGVISSGVSKELDYLVVGDGGGAGSKLDKANKLKEGGAAIEIITETAFLKMIGE